MQDYEATTLALLNKGDNETAVYACNDDRKQSICRDYGGCVDCLEEQFRYVSRYDPSGKICSMTADLRAWLREDGCHPEASNN